MRTAEETLDLLEDAILKRRLYLRRCLARIKKVGRERGPDRTMMLRGGMLSELSTVTMMLREIRLGRVHPDQLYNVEDDPDG